jgi:hypothetical protein
MVQKLILCSSGSPLIWEQPRIALLEFSRHEPAWALQKSSACSIQYQFFIDAGEAIARPCYRTSLIRVGEMRYADLSLSDHREGRTQQH